MRLLRRFLKRLGNSLMRWRDDERLREEIQAHLALLTEENIKAGMTPDEASRQANLKFGSVDATREECRAERRLPLVDSFLQDVGYGSRMLRKSPGFTGVAMIVLALGVGASTAIFSVLYAVSFRPLPYKNPDQLVVFLRTESVMVPFAGRSLTGIQALPFVSGPDFLRWKKQSDVFSSLAAAKLYSARAKVSGHAEPLKGYAVTPGFFKVFGVQPAKGRFFVAGDGQPGRSRLAILGPGFASRGSWASAVKVGGTLTLDGQEYDVIGSMPDSFRVAPISQMADSVSRPDVFVPIPVAQLSKAPPPGSIIPGLLMAIGRLKPGVTITRARMEMATIASRLARQYPATDAGVGVRVASMQSQVSLAPGMLMTMLLLGVGFLLLIACVNIAVMLLTQGARRRQEIAVRQAVGASPARIFRQLSSECLLLALAGEACGILLAFWLKDALVSLFPPKLIPRMSPIEINWQVLVFALAISVAASLLFGLIPALQISRTDTNEMLKEGSFTGSAGASRSRFRNAFVVCEVTLALALLVACGLVVRGISGVLLGSPGYNPKRMLEMSVRLAPATYSSLAARENVYRRMVSRLDASRLVSSSALFGLAMGSRVASADGPVNSLALTTAPEAEISLVSPGYFRTIQIPLLRGRPFTWADYSSKPSVAIVSASLAQELWPKQDPIGKHITTTFPPKPREVVGVAANAGMMGSGFEKIVPQIYFPELSPRAMLQVRTAGPPKDVTAAIQGLAAGVGSGIRVSPLQSMEGVMERATRPIRYSQAILLFMSFMVLLLATVGVSAVTASAVTQRTHEIGVRMAMGARPGQVLFAVMGEGVRLSLYGVAIGLLLALGVGRVLAHFLRGVAIGALSTYFEVALLLLVVTVVASYIAARRSTHINPVDALRCE